jgi:DNA-binding Lrp family transcriptional regulator
MKLVKFLDQKGTVLVLDPLNQTLLKNLVMSESSISELAGKLNLPTLKLWRRMQKLLKANLIEVVRTEKVGNIEKKFYRATATGYIPEHQFLEFKPKDANLQEAFRIYTEIQNKIALKISALGEVPNGVDPIDFALFASIQAFAQICTDSTTHAEISKIEEKLRNFKNKVMV